MMMTLVEVKGHKRSNGVNYVLCMFLLIYGAMANIFGQKKP